MESQNNINQEIIKTEIIRLRKVAEAMPNVIRFLDILFCQMENAKGDKEKLQRIDREVKKLKGEYSL